MPAHSVSYELFSSNCTAEIMKKHSVAQPLVSCASWDTLGCPDCPSGATPVSRFMVDAAVSLQCLKWNWILESGLLSQALTINRGEVRKVQLSCADLWFVGQAKHELMMLIYCAPPSFALT